ncbi:MAG TPA: hypothetical protein VJX67_14230 [Blastocatellia bacterium]|nr:hypothetical protein [Blastocatellia bacterium]
MLKSNFLIASFSFNRIELQSLNLNHTQKIVSLLCKVGGQIEAEQAAARRLISIAEHSIAYRRLDLVEHAANALAVLPDRFSPASLYYKQLALQSSTGAASTDREEVIIRLLEKGATSYRARAMNSLAAVSRCRGDRDAERRLYVEAASAAKADHSIAEYVTAQRSLAVWCSERGDHLGALNLLRQVAHLAVTARRVSLSGAICHAQWLNSLALELHAAGRHLEASQAIRSLLSMPFFDAWPTWIDTQDQIERGLYRSRSASVPTAFERGITRVIELVPRQSAQHQRPGRLGQLLQFGNGPMPAKKAKTKTASRASLPREQKQTRIAEKLLGSAADSATIDRLLTSMPKDHKNRLLVSFVLSDRTDDATIDQIFDALVDPGQPND